MAGATTLDAMATKSNLVLVIGLLALSFALGEHAAAGAKVKPTMVERVVEVSGAPNTNPQGALEAVIQEQQRAGFEFGGFVPMTLMRKSAASGMVQTTPVHELIFRKASN